MRKAKIEVFEGAKEWHWHLRSPNGRIVCQGEGHPRRAAARRAALAVQRAFSTAVLA